MSQTRDERISNFHVPRQVYRVTLSLRTGSSLQLPYMPKIIHSGDLKRLQDIVDGETSIRELYQRTPSNFLSQNPIHLLNKFDTVNIFSVPDDTRDYNNFSTQSSEEQNIFKYKSIRAPQIVAVRKSKAVEEIVAAILSELEEKGCGRVQSVENVSGCIRSECGQVGGHLLRSKQVSGTFQVSLVFGEQEWVRGGVWSVRTVTLYAGLSTGTAEERKILGMCSCDIFSLRSQCEHVSSLLQSLPIQQKLEALYTR